MSIEANIILLFSLLVLSAFFSGTETALVSLDRVRVRQLVKRGSRAAKIIEEFQADPQRMLVTILIGNNLVNIAAAAIATALALQVFDNYGIGIAVGIMTFLVLVFGEIIPKSLAVQNAEMFALLVAKPIKWLGIALTPVVWFLSGIAGVVTRIIGVSTEEQMTEQDVKTMVTMGAEVGAIHEKEKQMIHRIFTFDDIEVEAVMTPRSEIKAVEAGTTLKEIRTLLAETPYSRMPVFKKSLDSIAGVFYVKDAWNCLAEGKVDRRVSSIMRPAMFTPKTKKIDKLLAEFQQTHNNMGIVVDDYGGIVGLVTLEDLLEEIVGEIADESELPPVKRIDKNTIEVEGKTPIGEVNRILRTRWKSDNFQTMSGFLIEKLDRLPGQGEEIKMNNYTIKAVKVKEPRILRIKIEKLPQKIV